ncbi:2-hydroxyglutarate dehydrogenase isoform 2 [Galdieria sulphuraria]|uniref:L-2-hydroxyglutarate dehydrogenase, mitochondrial n=1 Tax=Galdieria sulphuraria TaxID=130081 RepID=M2WX70_GALSU|nr:2-hydroxyglutarate dehydrogenase isoform 1 [Galdieria sulphuraria]XP_005705141.1 2-hydroxyglutarate dehydrogenase isoform 2 [Galdieria sulphuraria]EME28620.1 2-hydroxyglutarate dehydrogenase isoform 1 [Galdieria sulphuraria]EME28621.1 2-hydroxyglutarate dehydrogenase isoform 2 [Galdieria sulphuraria]|eukprot:XP_005705140.1 2-hydroxyglutarate dehydrogenase isoform 1 [Galdieria sulphuraria]
MWRNAIGRRLHTTRGLFSQKCPLERYFCTTREYDIAIIGAGIVGMATARELAQRYPDRKIVVLEKEAQVAQHQSKHNSGVIHAGIFYKPGSNKARLCVQGASLMYEYCKEHKIPHEKVGKLIIATNNKESEQLDNLFQRGVQNGVKDLELIDEERIRQLEPYVRGKRALYSPHTGICHFELVTRSFENDFLQSSRQHMIKGFLVTSFHIHSSEAIEIRGIGHKDSNASSIFANYVICCAGLSADTLATLAGGQKYPVIIPFRGRYRLLKEAAKHLVKRNIYPVPDPKYPFLGIHFTPTVQGQITIGPSAALSLTKNPSTFKNLRAIMGEKALWNFLRKNLTSSLTEGYFDVFQKAFVKRAQSLVPSLNWNHTTVGWQGVRAQAMAADGSLVEDFVFESLGPKGRLLHVRNAPSPAATSSLAIAKSICDRAATEFFWHS